LFGDPGFEGSRVQGFEWKRKRRDLWLNNPKEKGGFMTTDYETRYRRLFETARDGILILDAQTGRIEDAIAQGKDDRGIERPEPPARQRIVQLLDPVPFVSRGFDAAVAIDIRQAVGHRRFPFR